tara:strand:- start:564 stop:857 length:294 start_codon:yes stop_codon:yes gene_type:complete
MFAKSEAASPLPKIYGTTHNKKVHDSALEAHHPMTKKMEYSSAMPKMDDSKAKKFYEGMASAAASAIPPKKSAIPPKKSSVSQKKTIVASDEKSTGK